MERGGDIIYSHVYPIFWFFCNCLLIFVRFNDTDVRLRVEEIDKTIKNYRARQGLTNFPITIQNLCQMIPSMHAKIKESTRINCDIPWQQRHIFQLFQVFEFVLKLITRQNTTQKPLYARFRKGEKAKEKQELMYLRSKLREELGIKVGVKTGQ